MIVNGNVVERKGWSICIRGYSMENKWVAYLLKGMQGDSINSWRPFLKSSLNEFKDYLMIDCLRICET
jgi:hypothetical protein